ncbi:MAG TPA: hypothetical protein P5526_08250 [Anaerolineae bacterium]|nr:hypothetical protein [Anaerolineae bacterium]
MSEPFPLAFIIILQMFPTILFTFTGIFIAPLCVFIVTVGVIQKQPCKGTLSALWLSTIGLWFIGLVSFVVLIILTDFSQAINSLPSTFILIMLTLTIVMICGSGVVAKKWCWLDSGNESEARVVEENLPIQNPSEELKSLKAEIRIHQKNLRRLKEREAKYGSDAPISLMNQIDDEEEAIDKIKKIIEDLQEL